MKVRIFITGGTFDKEYDEIHGKLYFTHTHIDEILKLGRSQLPVNVTELMLIDSLDMTEAMRSEIREACRKAEENQIVITHGTDTMCRTAQSLPPGVYVAMNGRWFPWDRVRKNRESGIFEEIQSPDS